MNSIERADIANDVAKEAGKLAYEYFLNREKLVVDDKGHQDFVSEADKLVEILIRERLSDKLPEDAIVGEEHAPKVGSSGFTWVIDPIDGTTNFLNGVPFWCVAIAGVADGRIEVGVVHDPNHDETFHSARHNGAFMNGKRLKLRHQSIKRGTVCIGSSRRSAPAQVGRLVQSIIESGGIFARTGSGALGLAHVAAGRYIGYTESYMNAWDCLAGQLLVDEAGGVIEKQDADLMIANGGAVVAAALGVFDDLLEISRNAFRD